MYDELDELPRDCEVPYERVAEEEGFGQMVQLPDAEYDWPEALFQGLD